LQASDVHWIAGAPPQETHDQTQDQTNDQTHNLSAKTRYRQDDALCRLTTIDPANSELGSTFTLDFPQPQWAVTPGQSAVLYRGEVCLGGGVIHSFVSSERSIAGAA